MREPQEPGGRWCEGEECEESVSLHHWRTALAGCWRREIKMEPPASLTPTNTTTEPHGAPAGQLKAELPAFETKRERTQWYLNLSSAASHKPPALLPQTRNLPS